jgi:hypothetical protein
MSALKVRPADQQFSVNIFNVYSRGFRTNRKNIFREDFPSKIPN